MNVISENTTRTAGYLQLSHHSTTSLIGVAGSPYDVLHNFDNMESYKGAAIHGYTLAAVSSLFMLVGLLSCVALSAFCFKHTKTNFSNRQENKKALLAYDAGNAEYTDYKKTFVGITIPILSDISLV